jgi:3-phenylpropionate/trans-cinnamate dioxygenase ferredoxin reductase subunit
VLAVGRRDGVKSVAVVGTFLAGLRCAQELWARFGGELVLIGDEPHRPYDRPPLSKDFLLGNTSAEELELTGADELLSLEARWHLGSRAERLDAAAGTITLADGTEILADGVVVATGGRPRTLPASPTSRACAPCAHWMTPSPCGVR